MSSDAAATEVLLADQRESWESGRRTLVESLLQERADLSTEQMLDVIYNEIVLREERGEHPSFDEYAQRFPALASELRLQFEVHDALGRTAPEPSPPSVPGYEIVKVLGRGGMGVVYAANQTSLERQVALKFLPPAANEDQEALQRFRDEARAASSLNHPHVAMIFDFGTHEARPFIVMELVVGRTLAEVIREKRSLPVEECVAIVRQAAQALAAAHESGLVHRDIKPANLMVRDDGYVKVLDFGLARLCATFGSACRVSHTAALAPQRGHLIAGTPRYMSPEQLRGEQADPPSDVYSLGLVLQELLPPPIDPPLQGLLSRMLGREASERPTMGEVAAALSRAEPRPARGVRRAAFGALAVALIAGAAWFGLAPRPRTVAPAHAPASIVVLPFTTVGDPAGAYFSAGVTEDITAMLARAPDIAVSSTSAALAYKDKAEVDPRVVGRELGVGYVLVGSVRKEERQVRITARLVDARTGTDVWAERLDRTGTDPWALQDEIAGRIVGALTGEYGQLKRAQYRAAWGTDSTGIDEYDHYLRGHELYMRLTPDDNDRAGEAWRRGLTSFPDSALLKTKLGFHHFMRPFLFFRDGAAADYARAGELARQALARPHVSPLETRLAHWLFAYVSAAEGDYDRALREMDVTLSLAPYDMFQLGDLSTIPIFACKIDLALKMADKALEADPANRPFYQQLRGWALAVGGRYAESVTALTEGIELTAVPLLQAINYTELGRTDDARKQVQKALADRPDLTLAKWRSANFYRDRAVLDRQLADLAAAGLP